MGFYIALIIIAAASAFTLTIPNDRETTKIKVTRRETLTLIGGLICSPLASDALSQQPDPYNLESQPQGK